jgi:dipeptidyl aminopeptidase/acylaminoacyl peptidase
MRASPAIVLLLFLAVTPAWAQAPDQRAFTPADWYRLTSVSSPAMSPAGDLVAFTVTRAVESENERHSEVWAVRTDGGEPFRLTAPGLSSSNPRWSDDGKTLFFTSRRPGGAGSTWALRMDQPGEAVQIEEGRRGSASADGSRIVWTAPPGGGNEEGEGEGEDEDEASEEEPDGRWARMPGMARPPYGAITEPLVASRFDGRHVVEMGYKRDGRGFVPNPARPSSSRPSQLWVQTLGDTAGRQLTHTPYSHRGAAVSPDGRWIAFTSDPALRPDSAVTAERDSLALLPYDPERDEARRNDADIFVVSIEGGEPRRLTDRLGSEGSLAWSPDGRFISFVSTDGHRTDHRRLYLVPAGGGEARALPADWRYEPGGYEWLPDGDIALTASIGGRSALYRLSPHTGEVDELVGGRRRVSGFSYDRDFQTVAFISTSINRPTELHVLSLRDGSERRLTGFNDELNAEIAWSDAERFTYRSVDDFEIEAWLMEPYGYEPGNSYPLVLYIHGGPHSAYGEGWFDEFQNLAGAGMWVLFTNPRGSSGYGGAFTYSTRGRWGLEDYEDIMKAVDIVAGRSDVDETRMGVTGGSYGGFMTAWITTKTHRFAAAQADRMISNWWSWYGTSDVQGLTEFEFYGTPWDNPTLYDDLSPIRFARNVTTPTLIVQSEEDHRTPMVDAEQWFTALKKHGVPVELVRYPRSSHGLSRTGEPWLLVDRLGRLRQWFGYWLGEDHARRDAGVSR